MDPRTVSAVVSFVMAAALFGWLATFIRNEIRWRKRMRLKTEAIARADALIKVGVAHDDTDMKIQGIHMMEEAFNDDPPMQEFWALVREAIVSGRERKNGELIQ